MQAPRNFVYSAIVLLALFAIGYIMLSEEGAGSSAHRIPNVSDTSRPIPAVANATDDPADLSALTAPEIELAIAEIAQPRSMVVFDKHQPDTSRPLRLVYDELKAEADSGNPDAALDLAGSLVECAEAPANEEALERQLLDLYQTRRVTGFAGQVQDLETEAKKHRDRYAFCEGVSREQVKEAYKYLRVSAENGNIEAAVRLDGYGPMLYSEVFDALDIAWESEQEMSSVSNRLIFEAAEAGSANAILKIGRYMEEGGDILSADDAQAYRIVGFHLYVLQGSNVERYGSELRKEIMSIRPPQRAEVIETANRILERGNCCFFIH